MCWCAALQHRHRASERAAPRDGQARGEARRRVGRAGVHGEGRRDRRNCHRGLNCVGGICRTPSTVPEVCSALCTDITFDWLGSTAQRAHLLKALGFVYDMDILNVSVRFVIVPKPLEHKAW